MKTSFELCVHLIPLGSSRRNSLTSCKHIRGGVVQQSTAATTRILVQIEVAVLLRAQPAHVGRALDKHAVRSIAHRRVAQQRVTAERGYSDTGAAVVARDAVGDQIVLTKQLDSVVLVGIGNNVIEHVIAVIRVDSYRVGTVENRTGSGGTFD